MVELDQEPEEAVKIPAVTGSSPPVGKLIVGLVPVSIASLNVIVKWKELFPISSLFIVAELGVIEETTGFFISTLNVFEAVQAVIVFKA